MTRVLDNKSSEALGIAAESLRAGGVIVVPTDTVYGLAVLPSDPAPVERLFAIKSRPDSVNLPVMVANMQQLQALGARISPSAEKLMNSQFVPGAVTLVFGIDRDKAPDWLKHRDEFAVRIPDDAFLLSLIETVGPIHATSANRHGSPTPSELPDILAQLEIAPDLAVDGGTIDTIPSTLVNCNVDPVKIERVGVVPVSEIERVLESGN